MISMLFAHCQTTREKMQKTTHTNRERASCFERNVKIIYMLNQIKLDILSVLMKISALQMFQQPKSPKKFGSHSTINHFVIGNMLRVEKNCRYFTLERCIERKKTDKNSVVLIPAYPVSIFRFPNMFAVPRFPYVSSVYGATKMCI